MRKIKYFVVVFIFLLCNCKSEKNIEIDLNGYYGMTKYFQSKNTNSDYIEDFLLKIDTNEIKIFGTVQSWGRSCKYKFNKTGDTILLGEKTKIYSKFNDHNVLYFETIINGKIETIEYQKIELLETTIDKDGINSKKLASLLNDLLIVGEYKYENKIVSFDEEGKVKGLDEFRKYSIRPRLGTLTYYDNKILETENGIWKYQKKNDDLILTKYTNRRDENEMYILGSKKIELKKTIKN